MANLPDFIVPVHDATPAETSAAVFMLRLSLDLDLQERYRTVRVAAVAENAGLDLSERARKLLGMAHPITILAAIAEPGAALTCRNCGS